MLKFQYVLKTVKKHVENFRIQVLKWSVPDAHPDSRVLSILKFSGIFENCMRGIFSSLRYFTIQMFRIFNFVKFLKRSTPDAHPDD